MNPMRKYEGLFVFPPEDAPEAWKDEEKRLEETLKRFGGKTFERRDWGRRPLGYPVRKAREGRFLLWNFEMETAQLGEFRKALQLDEKILKSMIVKAAEPRPVREKEKRKKPFHPREPGRPEREGIGGRQS